MNSCGGEEGEEGEGTFCGKFIFYLMHLSLSPPSPPLLPSSPPRLFFAYDDNKRIELYFWGEQRMGEEN